jgi:hypothetical protein
MELWLRIFEGLDYACLLVGLHIYRQESSSRHKHSIRVSPCLYFHYFSFNHATAPLY